MYDGRTRMYEWVVDCVSKSILLLLRPYFQDRDGTKKKEGKMGGWGGKKHVRRCMTVCLKMAAIRLSGLVMGVIEYGRVH